MGGPRVDKAEIIRLHGFGLSAAEIAVRLGCAKRTVVRVRAENGLSAPVSPDAGKAPLPERLAQAAALFADGASRADVRLTTGLHQHTIEKYFPGTAWSRTEVSRFARMVTELNKAIDGLALPNPKGTTK